MELSDRSYRFLLANGGQRDGLHRYRRLDARQSLCFPPALSGLRPAQQGSGRGVTSSFSGLYQIGGRSTRGHPHTFGKELCAGSWLPLAYHRRPQNPRPVLQSSARKPDGERTMNTLVGTDPWFQNVCLRSRGMKTKVPADPSMISSSAWNPNVPSNT